ncbi:MAG: N-formylglutamate deformylase [Planctomycetota bacterium]
MRDAAFELLRPAGREVPLLVSVPHCGREMPPEVFERFREGAVRTLPDNDHFLDRVYDFVPSIGGTLLTARYSRYLIDLNRPADGAALYPGRDETGLIPMSSFGGEPIYLEGQEPDDAERSSRVERYWRPYREALEGELERIRQQFGYALLWDGHSIRSVVPRFFEGELPALMLGDVDGTSADPRLSAAVVEVQQASEYSAQKNAPFKGGAITRTYGNPEAGVHALQLEMSQRIYMDEASPFELDAERTARLVPHLRECLQAYVEAAREALG